MDIHIVDSDDFSVEDVVKAHMEDVAVQEKFGVNQIKYWVDTGNKRIFCLMEGPSKEACNAVHVESHGNTACNIIEVSDDEYNLFLNIGKSKNDLAQTNLGDVDPGFRTFLLLNTTDFTGKYKHFNNQIVQIIDRYDGGCITQIESGILASFMATTNAVICAISIDKLLRSVPDNYEYKLAIVTGNPVDEEGNFLFEEVKKKIKILSDLGYKSAINMDKVTKSILMKIPKAPKLNSKEFNIVDADDFVLLEKLTAIFKDQIHRPDFSIERLNTALGLSKSQSYRKIKSVTGLSPNQLLREIRLQRSLTMIKSNSKTVAEIAYDLGFNSPTYFTRVFKNRFNTLPTSFSKL